MGYDAIALAEYLIYATQQNGKKALCNMVLQFFLYRIQTENLRRFGCKFFDNHMVATGFGPSCDDVYYRYYMWGAEPIRSEIKWRPEFMNFEKNTIVQETLAERKEYFFQYTNWFKYKNSAYMQAWESRKENEKSVLIPFGISDEFKKLY